MGQIVTFPFISGLATGTDKAVLPDGKLTDAQNVEMDRLGRLRVRPQFVAQPTTSFTGASAHVSYDLFTLNERLFSIGDSDGYGYPTDIYEYITGAAATWKPSSPRNATLPRLPQASKVRELAHAPNQPGGVSNISCAAFGGFACLAYNTLSDLTLGYVLCVKAKDNQPVIFEQSDLSSTRPCRLLRLVGLSDRLFIIGVSNNQLDISFSQWIPASQKRLTQVVANVLVSAAPITTFITCKVEGLDRFVVSAVLNGALRTRVYDNTGTVVVPSGGQFADIASAPTGLAVAADTTSNRLVVMYITSGVVNVQSYDLTTGAVAVASTTPFGATASTGCTLYRLNGSTYNLLAEFPNLTPAQIKINPMTTGGIGTARTYLNDAGIAGTAVAVPGSTSCLLPITQGARTVGLTVSGGVPNLLVFGSGESVGSIPYICKDFEIGGITDSTQDVVRDASTGKFYWANCTSKPGGDGDLLPQITEFVINDTGRRQTCQLGNLTYLTGGVPLVFDGNSAVESGFLTRPRVITLTPSTGTGGLLGGATYDYRVHAQWVDSDDNLHLSPPSAIETVTLGATENTVTANVSTHFTMRNNLGIDYSGSQVEYVLSRTEATKSATAATITGTKSADPPDAVLNGQPLAIHYRDASGTLNASVVFGAGDTSSVVIANTINASAPLNTVIVASVSGGQIVLSSIKKGSDVSFFLDVFSFFVAHSLGFLTGSDNPFTGTTTLTKGENFQRAASAYTASTGSQSTRALPIDIVDTRVDESDPINSDTDLVAQGVLYSSGNAIGAHNAPQPSQYAWASRERVELAGLPKRSNIQHSKTIVVGEPAEFVDEGTAIFVGANFFQQLRGEALAIAVLGDNIVIWTRREIWMITGSGPNRAGQGEFFAATRVSGAGGLLDDGGWRSLVETDQGIFFQLAGDKIYLLSKAGALTWIGRDAQDYLDLYPVVTCAIHSVKKHSVLFGLQSANGASGGILRFDLEAISSSAGIGGLPVSTNGAWFFDTVGPVTSMAEFGDQIAFVQGGIVYIQDPTPGNGTFVSYMVQSNMFQGFQALGRGAINKVGFLATYKGDCTVEASISYDGITFTSLGSFAVTSAEYTAGQRVVRLWDCPIQKTDQFMMRYVITGTSNSEGLWLHEHALDIDRAPELSRQAANHNK